MTVKINPLKPWTFTRDGRSIAIDGLRAMYLDLDRSRGERTPITPAEADCVAIQLFNCLKAGVTGIPDVRHIPHSVARAEEWKRQYDEYTDEQRLAPLAKTAAVSDAWAHLSAIVE